MADHGEACVVVINRNGPVWLRHIITIAAGCYNPDDFKAWYYDEYFELPGDEFVYCPTSKDRDEFVERIKKEEEE